ncbi:MAG: CsgG/HfaB family protein [Smithellaceae bacterium]|jgi:curli biogenesis system outer membrane secretion channel CsgG|nr:CsgG/HfaB family protein [Smithellaceae bacterium]HQG79704.1 CsgG/HfaB family protein [Smithellaceae bacterium]
MKKNVFLLICGTIILFYSGCATVSTPVQQTEAPVTKEQQIKAQTAAQIPVVKQYKRKIAIARFSNESNYGRSLMTDQDYDRIGKQASDMLAAKLIMSNKFIVLERTDLSKIIKEQAISGDATLVGVDALIIGSVTEFGRSVAGKVGFLSSTKVQVARAKVEARLVDVKTGHAFFSAAGVGQADTESGEIAGFGSRADYDATLNDRAISAAISDMLDRVVSTLEDRPWKTDILDIKDAQVFISGGKKQGIQIGDVLQVMQQGTTVRSKQTGFAMNLPPEKIAEIKVSGFFGSDESNEGSICQLISGSINSANIDKIFVEEVKK